MDTMINVDIEVDIHTHIEQRFRSKAFTYIHTVIGCRYKHKCRYKCRCRFM